MNMLVMTNAYKPILGGLEKSVENFLEPILRLLQAQWGLTTNLSKAAVAMVTASLEIQAEVKDEEPVLL